MVYLEHLDKIVLDGLFNCVQCSLRYVLRNTDRDRPDILQLLEAKLELQIPDMVFNPSLEHDEPGSFMLLIEELVDGMFQFASLVPRVATHKEAKNYLSEVEELTELVDLREEVIHRATSAVEKALEHRNCFDNYAYLWVDDRQEFMRQFLMYGHMLTAEELEQAGDEGVQESPPSLNQFKEQVDGYEKIYSEVLQFKVNSK